MNSLYYQHGVESALVKVGLDGLPDRRNVKRAVSEDWLIKRMSDALDAGIHPDRLHKFNINMQRLKIRNRIEAAGNYQDKPAKAMRMADILVDSYTGKSTRRTPYSRTPNEIVTGSPPKKLTAEEFLRKKLAPLDTTGTSQSFKNLGTAAEWAAKGPAQNAADARRTWAAPGKHGPSPLPSANAPTTEADVKTERLFNNLGLAGAGLGLTGMGLGAYALMRDKPKDEPVAPEPSASLNVKQAFLGFDPAAMTHLGLRAESALERLGLIKTADPLSAYLPRYSPEILERIGLRAGGGALAGGYGGMVAGSAQDSDSGGASGLLTGAALGGLAGGAHGALTLPRLRSANIFGPRQLAANSEAQTITDLLNAPNVPKTRDLLSGAAVGAIPGLLGGSVAGNAGSSD